MNFKRTLFGIGVMAIGFITIAGVGTWAFRHRNQILIHAHRHDSAQPNKTDRSRHNGLLSWLETTTLPILNDARAVPNPGTRGLTLSHLAISSPSIRAMASVDQWRPHWMQLSRPSVGRGGNNVHSESMMYPARHLSLTAPLMLPSLPLWAFNAALQGREMDGGLSPSATDATLAGRTTLQLLENYAGIPTTPMPEFSLERVPYTNPLGWSATSRSRSL